MMVAHIMGIPVEESVLQFAPAGAAIVTAVAHRRPDEARPPTTIRTPQKTPHATKVGSQEGKD